MQANMLFGSKAGKGTMKVPAKKGPAPKKVAPKKAAPKKVVKKAPSKAAPKDYSMWYGKGRRLFLPGGLLEDGDYNPVLDGSLPGDYGFDILNLAKDEETLLKYREAELIHGRWAMLGLVGVVVPEAIAGGTDKLGTSAVWFDAGKNILTDGYQTWFGAKIPIPLPIIFALEVALIGIPEAYRANQANVVPGITLPFTGKADSLYPGKDFSFDPLNLGLDPFGLGNGDDLAELKVKEIKNARLAMVAMLGVFVQAAVTKEGPYANWYKHVSDPFGYNLLTVVGGGLDGSL